MQAVHRKCAATILALTLGGCETLQPESTQPMSVGEAKAMWSVARSNGGSLSSEQCKLLSSPKTYSSGAGSDEIRVEVSNSGLVSLITQEDPFDTRALDQIGLRIDDRDAVLKPQPHGAQRLTFNERESGLLLDQMREGSSLRIQIVLYPRKELLTGVYSLRGFESALLTYRMCEVVRAEQAAKNTAAAPE